MVSFSHFQFLIFLFTENVSSEKKKAVMNSDRCNQVWGFKIKLTKLNLPLHLPWKNPNIG